MSHNVREAAKHVTRWFIGNCTSDTNTLHLSISYDGEAVCLGPNQHVHNVGLSLISLCGTVVLSIACGRMVGNPNWLKDTVYLLLAAGCCNPTYLTQFATHFGCLLLICLALKSFPLLQQWGDTEIAYDADNTGEKHVLKPLMFPCRTKHTRRFPTRHTFSYSYLFVGIPIGWKGSVNSMLSTNSGRTKTWFEVHADDYLFRGTHIGGLQGKLNDYLVSQGVDQGQYVYVYLVTAPRFLGFSFNPVSFWYLYNARKDLTAMILEVNNTFDERRMYLMQKESQADAAGNGFTSQWSKDFHVSPFNDRDGSYSLKVKNIVESLQIDNNIVLRSEEGRAKIVARVFSTTPGIDPATLSRTQQLSFVIRWWWVGFMTNPRILWEAKALWMKKLQVFYRPEVLVSSIGRNETADEVSLENVFRACLQDLVNRSSSLKLCYISAAGTDRGRAIVIEPENRASLSRSAVELRVVTPAFYSYLVHSMSLREAFDKYCFNPSPNEAMLHTSDPGLLLQLLSHCVLDDPTSTHGGRENIISLLRADKILHAARRCFISMSPTDKRTAQISEFDRFARKSLPAAGYDNYLGIVLWILVAHRFAFGLVALLRFYVFVLWAIMLGLTASAATSNMDSFQMTYLSVAVSFGVLSLHMLGRLTVRRDSILAY